MTGLAALADAARRLNRLRRMKNWLGPSFG
jgi:hypothetical protein